MEESGFSMAKLLFVWLLIMFTITGMWSVFFALTIKQEDETKLSQMALIMFKFGQYFVKAIIAAAILSLAFLGAYVLYDGVYLP